uniref:helix-turn-helix domain-containing protein n=1 Tax=Agathobacter sp. TaxID=2021311 RepID=UPI0040564135
MKKKRKKIQFIKVPKSQADTIAGRLQFAMEIRGYNQSQLAERIFVTRTTINGYCNGHRTPNCDFLRRIAVELDITTDYLLGLNDYIVL